MILSTFWRFSQLIIIIIRHSLLELFQNVIGVRFFLRHSVEVGQILHSINWHVYIMLCVLCSYPDFIAVAVVLVLTIVVALGVQCSTRFTTVFVVINILVLSFVTVCGIAFGHVSNWTSVEVPGVGSGFMPFGWAGVISGAASCFWAFTGFEMISCAVEESHSPQKHIPIATLLTMLIVTTLYIGTAAGMTLLIPCQLLDTGAPLPSAFAHAGLSWGRYIVVIGPLCGFTTTLVSNTFGFVRIALAMAEDGLLWSWLADVNEKTQVPVLSVILCGLLQALVACFCDIRDLVSFNVSLLLLSYSCVCVTVIVLQYSSQNTVDSSQLMHQASTDNQELPASGTKDDDLSSCCSLSETVTDAAKANDNTDSYSENGKDTEQTATSASVNSAHDDIVSDDMQSGASQSLLPRCICLESFMICKHHVCIKAALALMLLSMLGLAFVLIYGIVPLESGLWWSVMLVAVTSFGALLFMCIICIHRQTLQTAVLVVSQFLFCTPLTHHLEFLKS